MFSARLGFMRPDRVIDDLPPIVDSAQLFGYFDAGIYSSLEIDPGTGCIVKWDDRSGNGWSLIPTTSVATTYPTYEEDMQGRPAVSFNAEASQILGQSNLISEGNIPDPHKMVSDDPHTILFVDRHPGNPNKAHQVTWMLGGSGNRNGGASPDGRTADFVYHMGGDPSSSASANYKGVRTPARIWQGQGAILWGDHEYDMPTDRFVLQFSTWTGTEARYIADGGAGQDITTITGVKYNDGSYNPVALDHGRPDYKDNFCVGGRQYYADTQLKNGDQFSNTKVNKILIFKGVISDDDRQIIEGWAAHDVGIAEFLPDDHPYKSAPPEVN